MTSHVTYMWSVLVRSYDLQFQSTFQSSNLIGLSVPGGQNDGATPEVLLP